MATPSRTAAAPAEAPAPRRFWIPGITVWLVLVGTGLAGSFSKIRLLPDIEAPPAAGARGNEDEEAVYDEDADEGDFPVPSTRRRRPRRPPVDPMAAGFATATGRGVAMNDGEVEVPAELGGGPAGEPFEDDEGEEAESSRVDTRSERAGGKASDAPAEADAPPAQAPAPEPAPANPPPAAPPTPTLAVAIPPLPAPLPPGAAPAAPPPASTPPAGPTARDVHKSLAAALHEAEGVGRDAGAIGHAAANIENQLRKFTTVLAAYRTADRPANEAGRAREFAQKADRVSARLLRAVAEYKAAANRLAARTGDGDIDDPLAGAEKLMAEAETGLRALEAEAARAP